MFCFVINFRIVKQIEGVVVFPQCETKKKTNQPTHFISFHEWVLHKGKFIQAFLAGPHKES